MGTAGDGEAIAPKAQKPAEEIIALEFDDEDRVKVQRPKKKPGSMATRLQDEGDKGEKKKKKNRGPTFAKDNLGPRIKKYTREGRTVSLKGVEDMKLRGRLKKKKKDDNDAVFLLAKSEVLQTERGGFIETEGLERSCRFSQAQLQANSPAGTAKKRFSLDLPYGPYFCGYTPGGRHLLAGGRKGHLSLIQCDQMKLEGEVHLKETIRAVQPLHNHKMYAVAQKKYTYIYDNTGMELHCLKDQKYPSHLDFLPYHFLLVTATEVATIAYRDITTGQEVVTHKTRMGPTRSMRQHPRTGVMHLGHTNGVVTLWTPNVREPVARVLGHAGHVTSLAIHDNYMVTAGADGYWKVWDSRKYQQIGHARKVFGHAISDIDISMTGLVSIGFGSHLQIWKDVLSEAKQKRPYLTEEYGGNMVQSLRFQPYEDILCVGHAGGLGTLIVPGAGFANYDSWEANPYETASQKKEKEVQSLLEKLQPDSIMLDPSQIGNINTEVAKKFMEEEKAAHEEATKKEKKKKRKMRGKDKVVGRLKRKQLKTAKTQREKTRERIKGEQKDGANSSSEEDDDEHEEDGEEGEGGGGGGNGKEADPGVGAALGRFYNKRQRKT
eukprot:TRINITY_DN67056_c0_g1_i1.p1 TRINITY_DN67056_c0_g1~~TRINITY_DN67056_c0_g1_i1.p1  ORF type:complete len:628 (-),score=149.96 TRINITY_DN67056_c0_g1_i1:44-1861(-)